MRMFPARARLPPDGNPPIDVRNASILRKRTGGIQVVPVALDEPKRNIDSDFPRKRRNFPNLFGICAQSARKIGFIVPRKRIEALQKRFAEADERRFSALCHACPPLDLLQIAFNIAICKPCGGERNSHQRSPFPPSV